MARSSTSYRGGMKPPPHRNPQLKTPCPIAGPSPSQTELSTNRLHPQRDLTTWPPLPGALIGMPTPAECFGSSEGTALLLERMAERLAFERGAARIYEALLEKLDATPGKPIVSKDAIRRFRDEEAAHFQILCEAIESLGGDPLTWAPTANPIVVQASVLRRAIEDPRSPLAQCVDALLSWERVDLAGWEELLRIANESSQDALAQRLCLVVQAEREQVACVTQWASACAETAAQAAA